MAAVQKGLQLIHLFLGVLDALLEGDQVEPGQLLIANLVAFDAAIQEGEVRLDRKSVV